MRSSGTGKVCRRSLCELVQEVTTLIVSSICQLKISVDSTELNSHFRAFHQLLPMSLSLCIISARLITRLIEGNMARPILRILHLCTSFMSTIFVTLIRPQSDKPAGSVEASIEFPNTSPARFGVSVVGVWLIWIARRLGTASKEIRCRRKHRAAGLIKI